MNSRINGIKVINTIDIVEGHRYYAITCMSVEVCV